MADPSQSALDLPGLWEAFGAGRDLEIRAELIEHYLPLAKRVAARVYRSTPDPPASFEDYLQYARIGLIEAVDRFDVARGVPFEAYAIQRIRGALLNSLPHQSEAAAQRRFWRTALAQRAESLLQQTGRTPERASFQDLIDLTIGLALGLVLDDSGEAVEQSPNANPYAKTEIQQLTLRMRELVEGLPEREREVVKGHYFSRQEFQDLAQRFGVTKGRISQMHARALARLREGLDERPRLDRKV
jgi:RNA polymerase sigma factor for flagellar operon FliA